MVEAGVPAVVLSEFVVPFLTTLTILNKTSSVNEELVEAATTGSCWAYSDSLKYIWLASIPFGVCAIITSCFIGSITKYITNRVAAKIKE